MAHRNNQRKTQETIVRPKSATRIVYSSWNMRCAGLHVFFLPRVLIAMRGKITCRIRFVYLYLLVCDQRARQSMGHEHGHWLCLM